METPLETALALRFSVQRCKQFFGGSCSGNIFFTAQFHQITSTLVDVKRNVFFLKASTNAGPVSADYLPWVLPHILGRSPSLLLEFSIVIGSRCRFRTLGIRTDWAGRTTRTGVSSMEPSGCSIMATRSSSSISTRRWSQIT